MAVWRSALTLIKEMPVNSHSASIGTRDNRMPPRASGKTARNGDSIGRQFEHPIAALRHLADQLTAQLHQGSIVFPLERLFRGHFRGINLTIGVESD